MVPLPEGAPKTTPPCLEMRGIVKRFQGVTANDHIDLDLYPGEIHALLGENGAGKSTLMNVLYGLLRPDRGQILQHGRPVTIKNPRMAIARGIGMVHQRFMLVPTLSVAENVVLGREILSWGPFISLKKANQTVEDLSRRFDLAVDPEARPGDLAPGTRQRVEILKALYRKAEVLILDEPTSVLTPDEVQGLFRILASLAGQKKSIVFITHKLKEVMSVADRITVLRGGRVVARTRPKETSPAHLAELMVGRKPVPVSGEESQPGKIILRIESLQVAGPDRVPAVQGLSLNVRAGEIYGLAGVQGNGQIELLETITGLRPCIGGKVEINGHDVTNQSVRTILDRSVAFVPESGLGMGLVESFTIVENLVLNTYRRPPVAKGIIMNWNKAARQARHLVDRFRIKTSSLSATVSSLSGGNRQRLVMAREFSKSMMLLIAAQPTRGLDVASVEEIHRLFLDLRRQGCAVLLASTDLDEILTLSDRIGVMYRGKLAAETDAKAADRKRIGLWMAGLGEKDEDNSSDN